MSIYSIFKLAAEWTPGPITEVLPTEPEPKTISPESKDVELLEEPLPETLKEPPKFLNKDPETLKEPPKFLNEDLEAYLAEQEVQKQLEEQPVDMTIKQDDLQYIITYLIRNLNNDKKSLKRKFGNKKPPEHSLNHINKVEHIINVLHSNITLT